MSEFDFIISICLVKSSKRQFLWSHSLCRALKMRTRSWLGSMKTIRKTRMILLRCEIIHLYLHKPTSIITFCGSDLNSVCFPIFIAQGWALKTQKTVTRVEAEVRWYNNFIIWADFQLNLVILSFVSRLLIHSAFVIRWILCHDDLFL